MSDLRKLENLYNENIKIDDSEQSYYRGLLNHLLERVLIPELKRVNPDFSALYSHTYFGGSVFDGLKVKQEGQHFNKVSQSNTFPGRSTPQIKSLT